MQKDLSSESIRWVDAAGHDLRSDGSHLIVDAEKKLEINDIRVSDAGVYVCKVTATTSSDAVIVIRHVVKLSGKSTDILLV